MAGDSESRGQRSRFKNTNVILVSLRQYKWQAQPVVAMLKSHGPSLQSGDWFRHVRPSKKRLAAI